MNKVTDEGAEFQRGQRCSTSYAETGAELYLLGGDTFCILEKTFTKCTFRLFSPPRYDPCRVPTSLETTISTKPRRATFDVLNAFK
jgi:hypothetical protein